MFETLLLISIGYLVTKVFLELIQRMLLIANKTSKNYTGFKIPDAVGIVFVVASVISGTIGIVFNLVDSVRFYFFSFIGILMSFAGLIDDLL